MASTSPAAIEIVQTKDQAHEALGAALTYIKSASETGDLIEHSGNAYKILRINEVGRRRFLELEAIRQ